MPKELVQTRVPDGLKQRIENYQEENEHLNRSESIRTLLRVGLDHEQDTTTVEPAGDGEPEAVTDGGYKDRHRWVRPIWEIGERFTLYGLLAGLLALFVVNVAGGAVSWFGADLSQETAAIFLSLATILSLFSITLLVCGILSIAALEVIMPAAEAPVRGLFHTPDETDDSGEVVA